MYTTMTFDEFVNFYKPVRNKFADGQSELNLTFETFGEEAEFVTSHDEKHIWTGFENDEGKQYLVNGLHNVDAINYYVCEVPNALPKYQEVVIKISEECEDCEYFGGNGETQDGDACETCTDKEAEYTTYPTREDLIEIYGEEYANELA